MKLLIFMVLLICIASSHQKTFEELKQIWQSYVLKHSEKCLKETGADYTKAMRLLLYGEYVDDHKVKCFLSCIGNNLFITHEDGSIHYENFLDILNVKSADILQESDFVNKCFDIKLDDPCESFYVISECIFRALEKVMAHD